MAAGLGALLAVAGRRTSPSEDSPARTRTVPVPFISATTLQKLPEVTAQNTLAGAPPDDHPDRGTAGLIVHPRAPLPVFDTVAGTAFAQIRPAWHGTETWLPVIEQQPGWARVLLPSRPGTTGWLDVSRVTLAGSPYTLHLDVRVGELRLLRDNRSAGTWPAALGAAPGSVPAGRTFLLSCVRRAPRTAPVLLRLAVPINDRDPGLLTIHAGTAPLGEPGERSGIRVPDCAMSALQAVPPGCLVHIDAGPGSEPSPLWPSDVN